MAGDGNDLRTLASVSDAFASVCGSVSTAQLLAVTPCPEWDVSQLVDHVTGGNRFTMFVLDGTDGPAAFDLAVASFTASHDVVAAGIESTRAQLAAFGVPGALDRRCRHLLGDLTGAEVLRLRLHDLIIHTWDLQRALGGDALIDPDHVRWATAELRDPQSLTAQHFASVGAAPPRSSDALLAAFGRSA